MPPPKLPTRRHLDRRRLVAPVLLLALAAAAWSLGVRWLPADTGGALVAIGTLEAVELTVASEVTGRVVEVLAEEGDSVRAGDPLVRLDSATVDLQYRLAGPAERQLLALQREKYTLRAPRDGRVLRRAVQPGEVAVLGAGLLTLADPDRLELTVYVLQRDLGRVQIGAPVVIAAEALPGETFAGEVAAVSERAEFTPRNAQTPKDRLNLVFAVKVRLSAGDERLKPGMSVAARFVQ
ncbi:MAG: HlyD family efflux transporter periplasmic adaptor subunit [Chloroflexi bacterium]|nr:HlyD family efflux transporter periplasmic adaptor subunit [Chloroflexota bacterium]